MIIGSALLYSGLLFGILSLFSLIAGDLKGSEGEFFCLSR